MFITVNPFIYPSIINLIVNNIESSLKKFENNKFLNNSRITYESGNMEPSLDTANISGKKLVKSTLDFDYKKTPKIYADYTDKVSGELSTLLA